MKTNAFYRILSSFGEFITSPVLRRFSSLGGKAGEIWEQRMGNLPPWITRAAPFDLWIHGVSVGEISVVQAVVERVKKRAPETNIVVSSFTETGVERAEEILGDSCKIIAYPLDLPRAVERCVSVIRPRVYACVETELWPNLIACVKEYGARSLLLNARISPKSFRVYRKIRAFIAPVLKQFDQICTISSVHARRLENLGADKGRLEITGNAKYELLLDRPDQEKAGILRRRLGIPGNMKVIVFGSLRGREHQMIMPILQRLCKDRRDVFTIVVPRHMGRIDDVERAAGMQGLKCQLLSKILEEGGRPDPYSTDVLLVDRMGYLFDLYGLSTCAFVGGSLVPLGGQNIMEPAAWRKPVLFGPYMFNFEEAATQLLEEGGGMEVKDAEGLLSALKGLLNDIEGCVRNGELARKTLERLAGSAATTQAERILQFLELQPGYGK